MVRLREVFPHGPGFVLVFDYMLSDLAEVVRDSDHPLTEVSAQYVVSVLYCALFNRVKK